MVPFAEEESRRRALRNPHSADSTLVLPTPQAASPAGMGWDTLLRQLPWQWAQHLPSSFQGLQVPPRGAGIREGEFCKDSACISTWDQSKGQLPPPHGGEDCHLSGLLLAGCSWDCGFPPSRASRGLSECKRLHSDSWTSLHSLGYRNQVEH